MDPVLVSLLRCPNSGQALRVAGADDLAEWNDVLVGTGPRTLPDGFVLCPPFSEALIAQDGSVLYPVVDGLPVLTPDAGFRQPRKRNQTGDNGDKRG